MDELDFKVCILSFMPHHTLLSQKSSSLYIVWQLRFKSLSPLQPLLSKYHAPVCAILVAFTHAVGWLIWFSSSLVSALLK